MTTALEPTNKPIAPKRLNKRQRKFMDLWLGSPNNETYGNAYQSAIQAGFSDNTARIITTQARGLKWVQDGIALYSALEPEHIYLAIQNEALTAKASRDRLKGLELIGKMRGLFIDRTESKVEVKFTNSVPRPTKRVIDMTDTD